jgi:hypothetical protein
MNTVLGLKLPRTLFAPAIFFCKYIEKPLWNYIEKASHAGIKKLAILIITVKENLSV